ncbi:hypothetical protein IGI04_007405 [Brassica rapa subsp. trilocularis]|uniref:Uncharacterized protein n=1 Tax=Brassica rapa subsp. trilocularis TaxID=1813537 RepID=A0ABQ7NKW5_BRACM|nr:hypothetical protein IGI04_007405 [Brassica rapa subsp. trilocularis]
MENESLVEKLVMTQTQVYLTFNEAQSHFQKPKSESRRSSSPEKPCAVITFSSPQPITARDEAVATDHAEVGVRTRPHVPSEVLTSACVSPTRRRRESLRPPFDGAAVIGHRPSAAEKLPPCCRRSTVAAVDFTVSHRHPLLSPPVTSVGDSPVTRQLGRVDPVSQLGDSFNRAMSGSTDFGVASHTSLGDSPVAHPSLSPFQVRPTSRSDYRTGAIGLLGFYHFRFMSYFIFRMLSMLGL